MEHRMAHMTQMEIADAIAAKRPVILPTGATEAHGPHMPTDTDTHQAEHMAVLLAERIDPASQRIAGRRLSAENIHQMIN